MAGRHTVKFTERGHSSTAPHTQWVVIGSDGSRRHYLEEADARRKAAKLRAEGKSVTVYRVNT